jgi:uncharacterized membrane protein YoaK (UPF0700 family)
MTANMVLLGISAGQADYLHAGLIAVAIVSYIAGRQLGARIPGTAIADDPVWPPAITRGLAIEASVFVLSAAGWWATGSRPDGGIALGLLAANAVALGIQSSTVQLFGVPGLSTTHLIGALTTLVIRLTTGHRLRDLVHSLLLLGGLVGGAALAALLVRDTPVLAPLVQLVPLGAVLGTAAWHHLPGTDGNPR